MKEITIAIDAMGGDYGPEVTVPASLQALAHHTHLKLILVGDVGTLEKTLASSSNHKTETDRISLQHASERVAMDESPTQALRTKKDSSMRVAINLVKEGRAQACISAGNTGALMATARFVLKTLPGIDRPAIVTTFPAIKDLKGARVLDLGANVDSDSEHLYQFAVMGSVLVSVLDKIDRPKVGLLNIGQEGIKGNEQVKRTAQLLSETDTINYYGYIEGHQIFSGIVDVVVCDGFVGNVLLKTCEGAFKLMASIAKEECNHDIFSRCAAFITLPILKRLQKRLDPGRRNGASLIGLQGIVIKSHGGANVMAFAQAINQGVIEVEHDIPRKIRQEVSRLLRENP